MEIELATLYGDETEEEKCGWGDIGRRRTQHLNHVSELVVSEGARICLIEGGAGVRLVPGLL
jgi:hypothetical protein